MRSGHWSTSLEAAVASSDTALITGRVRPPAYDGFSSPCSCTAPSWTWCATSVTYSIGWLTKTPTGVTNGGRLETMLRARCTSMNRGLSGQNTNPIAPAPATTAASASSMRVIPQIFTNMGIVLAPVEHNGHEGHKGKYTSCSNPDLLCALGV